MVNVREAESCRGNPGAYGRPVVQETPHGDCRPKRGDRLVIMRQLDSGKHVSFCPGRGLGGERRRGQEADQSEMSEPSHTAN
jgi:hypothetical protein